MPENDIKTKATVKYIGVSGGFYAIETESGEKLDPVNLPEKFQQDGLAIEVTGRLKPDYDSVHMWGSVFEITEVENTD